MKTEPDIVKFMREYEQVYNASNSTSSNEQVTEKKDATIENYGKSIESSQEDFKSTDFKSIFCTDGELCKILVDNLFEGILVLDFTGNIIFANPAIRKMLGYKSDDKNVGKNILNFIHPNYYNKVIKDQFLVSIDKGGYLSTYHAITDTGESIWIEGIATKIRYKENDANVIFIRDVTERKKTWDDLLKLEEKYRALAETSADGIVTIDPLGQLTYVNPSFEKMCKKEKSELLSTLFREHLANESIYLFQQIFMESRKCDEKVENLELELISNSGPTIPIEVNISPLKKDEEFSGMICTVRDVTERRKIERELKKSEKLKTEFMNIAAHELKSPVTPIKGYLDLIISADEASDRIKNWAKISLRNSERLLRLVNDILDVSRLDSDSMRFDFEKIHPSSLLAELNEDIKPVVEKKGLKFNLEISKNLPNLMGDRCRLMQVFRNIVNNSIKFTDQGKITITATSKEQYVVITIEDTGIGMSEGDVKKIFSKFYQADTGNDRNNEGTGLGLFICREIIQRHNGKIWAESKLNEGSKFTIKLPIL
jgi:PAS domain S-box-containing protein